MVRPQASSSKPGKMYCEITNNVISPEVSPARTPISVQTPGTAKNSLCIMNTYVLKTQLSKLTTAALLQDEQSSVSPALWNATFGINHSQQI